MKILKSVEHQSLAFENCRDYNFKNRAFRWKVIVNFLKNTRKELNQ